MVFSKNNRCYYLNKMNIFQFHKLLNKIRLIIRVILVSNIWLGSNNYHKGKLYYPKENKTNSNTKIIIRQSLVFSKINWITQLIKKWLLRILTYLLKIHQKTSQILWYIKTKI